MKDLVERYSNRLLEYEGSRKGFNDILFEMVVLARDIGMQISIRQFARRGNAMRQRNKAKLNHDFEELFAACDDLRARNAEHLKQLDAHYRYFHKNITRR